MKKALAILLSFLNLCLCFILTYPICAAEISLGDAECTSPLEQVVILEPTIRPNKAYHMRCTVINLGEEPIKVAFNVLGIVPNIPLHYSLMPKSFNMLGDQVELESYARYEWAADPIILASPIMGKEHISFRVFDPHHLEQLKISDCYAVSISRA